VIPLWTSADAEAATGGWSSTEWVATGVSIDTRSLVAGDLFVALRGPNHDGHDFVAAALQRGAAAAMVDQEVPDQTGGPLLRVGNTLAALRALGAAARRRSRGRIIAVTGSVGKTGTKEALRLALVPSGSTYASAGGLNNHWGSPLSLARLPAGATYGIFELGMNHQGEIASLTRLVRPHVAVITTVEPAHLGFFPSVEAISDAKAEIFLGLEPAGTAILNRDNAYYSRLASAAMASGAKVISFGAHSDAQVRLLDCVLDPRVSMVEASISGAVFRYSLPLPGRHWVMNSLAVLATAWVCEAEVGQAAAMLAGLEALPGRGCRYELAWRTGILSLIDESYNASPAAMRAALSVLGATEPGRGGRRVAVLGDMLELGAASDRLHCELAEPLAAAKVDRIFLVGAAMAALYRVLPERVRGGLWPSPEEALPAVSAFLEPGDIVTVKGSRSVGLNWIVDHLRAQSGRPEG
jgi:UDP-N-acetylmuramoyl-tripeptide--D-alanyl-D-alanine ligase